METKELLELKELIVKQTEDFRGIHEEIAGIKAKGEEVPEAMQKKFDDLDLNLDRIEKSVADAEKKKAIDDKVETFMDSAKEFMTFAKNSIKTRQKATIEIFDNENQVGAEQVKALSTDIDPNGGYWLKPTYSGRIREFITETSPVRNLVTIETVAAGITEHIVPVELSDATGAGWVTERGSRSETDTPNQSIVRIPLHEVYADPKMTEQIMLNPSFNTEAWLKRKVAGKIARTENSAVVNGDGVGKPEGFMTNSDIGGLTSSLSGDFTFDDLIKLQTELSDVYNMNATWVMKRSTLRNVRLIQDGNLRYIWEPSGKVGVPSTLLGDPVVLMDDMPAAASGTKAIIRGDFKELYTMVDGGGIRLLVDPYTSKGYIEFYWSKYVGGAVIQPNAAKILTLKA